MADVFVALLDLVMAAVSAAARCTGGVSCAYPGEEEERFVNSGLICAAEHFVQF